MLSTPITFNITIFKSVINYPSVKIEKIIYGVFIISKSLFELQAINVIGYHNIADKNAET